MLLHECVQFSLKADSSQYTPQAGFAVGLTPALFHLLVVSVPEALVPLMPLSKGENVTPSQSLQQFLRPAYLWEVGK